LASRIGCKIDKIVFKGYRASEALQKMQNDGIGSRTKLLIEEEKERQYQKLLDYKLEKEQQRAQKRNELAIEQAKNQLAIQEMTFNMEMKSKEIELEHTLQRQLNIHEKEIGFLKNLKLIGVDISKYLVCQAEKPSKIVKHISGAYDTKSPVAITE